MALKDDPALISVCLINEGNLNNTRQGSPLCRGPLEEAIRRMAEEERGEVPGGNLL